MKLIQEVRRRLAESPASGGALIEHIPLQHNAVLIYGVLARLAEKKEIESVGEGPGERIWGVPGAGSTAPRPPGPPPTFRMRDEDLARIEKAVWAMTEGLPGHIFEELRRAVVARADRLAYEGGAPRASADRALAELGQPVLARRFLQKVDRGKHPPLRLGTRRARNFLVTVALIVAFFAALRWLVIGWYHLPEGQISMAPSLVPGVEGGDDLILANLIAYRLGEPARGDVAVFEVPGKPVPYIKRVMGLPGERVEIRQGDVWIDGKRLVKDKAFLERIMVPLFGMEGFERDETGVRQKQPAHTGFRLPDGSIEKRKDFAGDLVLEGAAQLVDLKDSLTILLKVGAKVRHQVVLNAVGFGAGVFVGNETVVRGQPCQLEPGRTYRFWLTNADRVFRFHLDGTEIARAEIRSEPADVRFEILGKGASDLRLSRDLVYTGKPGAPMRWTLGKRAYFLLGDNSPVSQDSRVFGAIPKTAMLGRAWRVVWPLDRAREVR
ncbi:MAG: signal peptidase I [Planctomycetota bacterium]